MSQPSGASPSDVQSARFQRPSEHVPPNDSPPPVDDLPPLPYPGLRPFQFSESAIFFGRGEQVAEMLTRLEDHRFLGVVGASGCGKSSLVRAGLLPAVARGFLDAPKERWRFVVVRPADTPVRNLASGLLGALSPATFAEDPDLHRLAFAEATLRSGPKGLLQVVENSPASADANVLVLVDQFEELFRFRHLRRPMGGKTVDGPPAAERDEAATLVSLLLAAAAQREAPIYIVMTMRSDFLGDCDAFHGLPEAISRSQFLTPRLTRDQASDAVIKPARLFGGEVEAALVNRILNEIGDDPDQLPLMQHVLMRLWNLGRTQAPVVTLTLADYEGIGGLKDALSRHVDEVLAQIINKDRGAAFAETQARVVEHLFRRLSEETSGGLLTRRLTRVGEVATVAAVPHETVISIVEELGAPTVEFLVTGPSSAVDGDSMIDIRHECLLRQSKTLQRWIDKETESAAMFLRLLDQTRREGLGVGGLWRSPDLDQALQWRDKDQPTAAWAARYLGSTNEEDIEKEWQACMKFLDKCRAASPAPTSASLTPNTEAGHDSAARSQPRGPASTGSGFSSPKALEVHLFWHPSCHPAQALAQTLYRSLCNDPDLLSEQRLGIPVRFWNAPLSEPEVEQRLFEAEYSAAVVLVDDQLALDARWGEFFDNLTRIHERHGDRHRILPVALSPNAYSISGAKIELNFLRLFHVAEDRYAQTLIDTVIRLLWSLLARQTSAANSRSREEATRVYISHSKKDGEKLARMLRDYLDSSNLAMNYVMAAAIQPGMSFEDHLREFLIGSFLIILHTDDYSTREWCLYEVLEAKRHGIPAVIVNALDQGESRSFPYLGNLPVLHWSPRNDDSSICQRILSLLLWEALRFAHFARKVRRLEQVYSWMNVKPIPFPPELLTALNMRDHEGVGLTYVYPDPPLSSNESKLIHDLDPQIDVVTPTMMVARQVARADGKTMAIGISTSEPAGEDLSARGLAPKHVTYVCVELARYLFALGHTLAFGGMLNASRDGSYGSHLVELGRLFRDRDKIRRSPIRCYVPFPWYLGLAAMDRALLLGLATVIDVAPPLDIAQHPRLQNLGPQDSLTPTSAEDKHLWARCLTQMRRRMNAEIDAHVLVGGRRTGFIGGFPGLLEVAHLAIRSDKPLFLLGGFGGVTSDIIDVLHGRLPETFTTESQVAGNPAFAELTKATSTDNGPADSATMTGDFRSAGVGGLKNGLSESENERLFVSTDIDELIGLILKGLAALP